MEKTITQTAGRDQPGEFAPMFAHLNDDVLFGKVWKSVRFKIRGRIVSMPVSDLRDALIVIPYTPCQMGTEMI